MCLTPINLQKTTFKQKLNDTYFLQQVPCGKCLECRKLRVNSWFVRLLNEKNVSTSAHFVTLTFEDDYLPYSDNGLCTLDYGIYQRFVKRLRKADKSEKSIKYFAVGEYGEKTYRPHFHALMFNVNNVSNIEKTWQNGHIHVGEVKEASIYYTLKYALKSTFRNRNKDPDDDRQPEKALMSKGLGSSFLTPQMIKYYKDDPTRPVTMLGNQKIGLPRYYRDKIFDESEKRVRNKGLSEFVDLRYEQISDPLFPQRVKKMYDKKQKQLQKTD